MPNNKGKKFEELFESDWNMTFPFPKGRAMRLRDNMNGFRFTSRNVCDFVCFADGVPFLIEAKSHLGNTFPFSELRQYDDLLSFKGLKGVHPGVVLWMRDHDKVLYFPIETLERMKADGHKSINVNKLEGYDYLELPSFKKRVYLTTDYTNVLKHAKGELHG